MRRGKPNEPLIVGRVRPYGPAVGRANHRPELLLAISGEETRFADREAAKLRVRIVKLEEADNRRRIHSDRLLTEEAIKLAARHPLERQVADLQLPYGQQIVLRLRKTDRRLNQRENTQIKLRGTPSPSESRPPLLAPRRLPPSLEVSLDTSVGSLSECSSSSGQSFAPRKHSLEPLAALHRPPHTGLSRNDVSLSNMALSFGIRCSARCRADFPSARNRTPRRVQQ